MAMLTPWSILSAQVTFTLEIAAVKSLRDNTAKMRSIQAAGKLPIRHGFADICPEGRIYGLTFSVRTYINLSRYCDERRKAVKIRHGRATVTGMNKPAKATAMAFYA
jgi:hypothetical protein